MVDCCFLCGRGLTELEDKIGHKINPQKGNSEHNLLILCTKCKQKLIKSGQKIWKIPLNPLILCKYFRKISIESRKIIINKLKIMRNKENI